MTTSRLRNRPGSALLVILPCILLIELIVAGALAIATVQTADGGLRTRRLQARIAAESAVRHAIHQIPTLEADSLRPGQSMTVPAPDNQTPAIRSTATLLALHAGRLAAFGASSLHDRPATTATAIVEILTADTLWSLFRAALHTDGDVETADAANISTPDETATAQPCPALASRAAERASAATAPAILLPADRTATLAPLSSVTGSPAVMHILDSGQIRNASMALARALAALADHSFPAATITPRPSSLAGHCVTLDPVNWGDPAGLTACAEHRPLIHVDGDLHIRGGVGQAFLIVDGNLHIDNAARFDGAILTTGNATIGDAVINGAVRSLGTGTTLVAGTLARDICTLWLALGTASARKPFRRSDRLWLPMD